MQDVHKAFVDMLKARTSYLALFDHYDTRMEGWFQAEFLALLATLPEGSAVVQGVNKKAPDRSRPDFLLRLESGLVKVELKSLVQGRRSLGTYFRQSWGRDLQKIRRAPAGKVALLTIVIPLPDRSEWKRFEEKALRRYSAEPLAEDDIVSPDGPAKVTLWTRSH